MSVTRVKPVITALRTLPHASTELCAALGAPPATTSLAFITCDQDDSLYAALDHATKMAAVDVVFAKSFYAGSKHASGPLSGEIMGVLASADPDILMYGVRALRSALDELYAFYSVDGTGVSVFPTVISQTGRYLSREVGITAGEPLGYLVAPPFEAMIGLDAAIKAAAVTVKRIDPPPSPTNFAGGFVTGTLDAVEAAAAAFR
ncbi:MAG: ethanolamine utilization microcompartment protein EutL, partial [Myxococcota bacterium]